MNLEYHKTDVRKKIPVLLALLGNSLGMKKDSKMLNFLSYINVPIPIYFVEIDLSSPKQNVQVSCHDSVDTDKLRSKKISQDL